MQIFKRNKGITLVALIITIIILLILAGVSISFLIGDNGVINKSQSAVNEYEEASKKEQELLKQIDDYLGQELSIVDKNGLAKKDTTIVAKDDPSVQIVIPKGFAPAILQTGTTQSLPGENGAVKNIMPANEWNNITKADINSGIVVVDNAITYDGGQPTGTVSDFNEYVWIPMSDSSKFARVAWTTPYGHNENGIWGNWNSKQLLAEVSTLNRWYEDKNTEEYLNMVSSVNENKGFYISRYEASQKDITVAQSKRNQNPWIEVSQTTVVTASRNMNPNINSHLIYGIEWDSILQWLLDSGAKIGAETSGMVPKTITLSDIQTDSRSWGNYSNSIADATSNSGSEQQTGTNEYWKVNNIYDLAGNVHELTQEEYIGTNTCANRGGVFTNGGNGLTAAYRGYNVENGSNYYVRVQSRFLCVVL